MNVDTDVEALRLRVVLRDLVALSAIPAAWIGSEPPAVAAGLADALVGLLQLDFAFVRLSDPGGAGAVEVTRGSAWTGFPEWLEAHLATSAPFPRNETVPVAGEHVADRRAFAVPIGVNGEGGVVAAACERADFPTPTDRLLLSLGANHAAAAFRNARLIHERKRAEGEVLKARNELEVKVTERTAELHLANEELRALRHVATLAAEGVQPQDLFAVVAEEVSRVVGAPAVSIVRYEADGTATELANYFTKGRLFPVGVRMNIEGTNVLRLVRDSSEAARIDDYSQTEGELAEIVRNAGVRSTVAVPIVVAGGVWGATVGSTTEPEPLPDDTASRLADFTELLSTAIENAESRESLERLAEEQAALRRVATLVALGVRPAEIFSAVSGEIARLFRADLAVVAKYELDPPSIVVVGIANNAEEIPIESRWELDDRMASTKVFRTGRSARLDDRAMQSGSGPVAHTARRLGLVSTLASPIIVEGRLWGVINVSAKAALPLDTGVRLESFTELVATAIANAASKSELAASRRRIVAASDEARRRIERNLHDGTQQRLVSLVLAVRAAEADVPPDRDSLRADLSRIAQDLAAAVDEVQELSRGIHPAVLSEGGLGPALRTLASRSAIPIELEVTKNTRFPEPIEAAAYYVASEALANATKHAQASRIEVSLAAGNGSLLLSIRDDGVGGAEPARGSGLIGLTDRVEALGGSIKVQSRAGDGTQITAELPLAFAWDEDSPSA